MRVLAGDIGGTNARVAIIDVEPRRLRVIDERHFASNDFPSLASILHAFLADVADVPSRACFGVAGPVIDGRCRAVNLPWMVDAAALAFEVNIPEVVVINDLHAVARGLSRLRPRDLVSLQDGEVREQGTIAVIGAGTGLGEAFLTWDGTAYRVHDSEGGHATFGARNDDECELLRWLGRRFGHVSRERVVSGPGLVNIYDYLVARGDLAESVLVRRELEREDRAAVIARHALAGSDPLSIRALDMFASAYGAQAANLALTGMATGGVYVAGGIAPRIVSKLRDGSFISAFRDKGRLSDVLARVPVRVILNPHTALIGAATVAHALPTMPSPATVPQLAEPCCAVGRPVPFL